MLKSFLILLLAVPAAFGAVQESAAIKLPLLLHTIFSAPTDSAEQPRSVVLQTIMRKPRSLVFFEETADAFASMDIDVSELLKADSKGRARQYLDERALGAEWEWKIVADHYFQYLDGNPRMNETNFAERAEKMRAWLEQHPNAYWFLSEERYEQIRGEETRLKRYRTILENRQTRKIHEFRRLTAKFLLWPANLLSGEPDQQPYFFKDESPEPLKISPADALRERANYLLKAPRVRATRRLLRNLLVTAEAHQIGSLPLSHINTLSAQLELQERKRRLYFDEPMSARFGTILTDPFLFKVRKYEALLLNEIAIARGAPEYFKNQIMSLLKYGDGSFGPSHENYRIDKSVSAGESKHIAIGQFVALTFFYAGGLMDQHYWFAGIIAACAALFAILLGLRVNYLRALNSDDSVDAALKHYFGSEE